MQIIDKSKISVYEPEKIQWNSVNPTTDNQLPTNALNLNF